MLLTVFSKYRNFSNAVKNTVNLKTHDTCLGVPKADDHIFSGKKTPVNSEKIF